ncbi:MAG: aminopeptidase P family protein [Pseudomonadota bacterium]
MFQNYDAPPDGADATHKARISQLRKILTDRNMTAYFVPRSDAHQGEYVAPCDERLRWLTGFTGSAGYAVVAAKAAALFVDGRYTLQAAGQVPTDVMEIVDLKPGALTAWCKEKLPGSAVIAFDPMLMTQATFEQTSRTLAEQNQNLKPVPGNLIDRLWAADRPDAPNAPIKPHALQYAGVSAAKKIEALQTELTEHGDDAVVLTQPDSIAWLLNIRGADVAHNPVVQAFAIVPKRGPVELYTALTKLTPAAKRHFGDIAIVKEPAMFEARLKELNTRGTSVAVDPASTAFWITRRLSQAKTPHRTDPCLMPKAIKNTTEIDGARAAHVRDGAAYARFLSWLEAETASSPVDEITAAQALEGFRAETGALQEISFDTISGSGPNGAIVHYRVTHATNRRLKTGQLYLVDSGAQYLDGTTDITRTIAIGKPTKAMRRHATLVLKGHIAIARALFPVGTRGIDLDPLARQALWSDGLDFSHGTGHGVGSYLSVHEGPQSISKRGMVELKPGMIISNEPGYYRAGAYGIRIENLVLVQSPAMPKSGDREMLSFETLTLAPIDKSLIETRLLTDDERGWIDAYHARVAKIIGPELDAKTRKWLKAACKPLGN